MNSLEERLLTMVNTQEPTALVERFSTLVRMSGTASERQAVEYVTGRLRAFGIPHRLHEPTVFISLPERAELTVTAPERRPIRA